MNSIFILKAVMSGYDGAITEILRACETRAGVETEKARLEKEREYIVELRNRFFPLYNEWQEKNPPPDYNHTPLNKAAPKWDQKWGAKKKADPAFLADFVKKEEEYLVELREHHTKLNESHNEYEKIKVEAGKVFLEWLNADRSIIENFTGYLTIPHDEYDFEIEEVPFGE